MFDFALHLAQTLAVLGPTAWLITGLRDNLLHPQQNEAFTAEVLEMRRLREGYPEAYEAIAHRAIADRKTQLRMFRLVVIGESVACLLLVLGSLSMLLALLGLVASDTARALSLFGLAAFVSVWTGMLVVGNHFGYWFAHEGAQNTHFQLTLWGMASLVLIAL